MNVLLSPVGFPFVVNGPGRAAFPVSLRRAARGRWRRAARAFLGCFLLLALALGARAYDPAVVKVMSNADLFGTYAFEGDTDVNASGQWIAASRKGVFLSDPANPQVWQQVFTAAGNPMVTDGITDKILCRINNNGGWAMINRIGIYRSVVGNNLVGELITATVGSNNVYDLDMDQVNGHWIVSSSQSTRVFTSGVGGVQTRQNQYRVRESCVE